MMQFSSKSIMRRTMFAALAGVLAVMMVPQAASAQADPFIGTWKLNPERSTYGGQQPWRSNTQIVKPAAQGLAFTEDIVTGNGTANHTVLSLIYDGQPHPVTEGAAGFDSIMIRRIDASTQEWSLLRNGEPRLTGRIDFSPDGRTATWTITGTNAQGQAINRTQVYEKQ
jgi:hypothetical protein